MNEAGAFPLTDRHLRGTATVRRVGWRGFPAYELVHDGRAVASLGRFGWFRTYLGPGQRIELADGRRWRLRSIGVAGAICPVVVDSTRRKVATSGLRYGAYGLNTKDDSAVLYEAEERRFGRANRWLLRRYEEELAVITRSPLALDAAREVPLGMALLCFVLVRYGIPGERGLGLPGFRW